MLGEWFADFKVDATSIQASNFPIIVFRADSVAVVNISRSEEAKKERQETVELLPVPGKFEAHQEQSIAIAKMRLWFNIGNQGEYSEDGNFVVCGLPNCISKKRAQKLSKIFNPINFFKHFDRCVREQRKGSAKRGQEVQSHRLVQFFKPVKSSCASSGTILQKKTSNVAAAPFATATTKQSPPPPPSDNDKSDSDDSDGLLEEVFKNTKTTSATTAHLPPSDDDKSDSDDSDGLFAEVFPNTKTTTAITTQPRSGIDESNGEYKRLCGELGALINDHTDVPGTAIRLERSSDGGSDGAGGYDGSVEANGATTETDQDNYSLQCQETIGMRSEGVVVSIPLTRAKVQVDASFLTFAVAAGEGEQEIKVDHHNFDRLLMNQSLGDVVTLVLETSLGDLGLSSVNLELLCDEFHRNLTSSSSTCSTRFNGGCTVDVGFHLAPAAAVESLTRKLHNTKRQRT